MTATTNSRAHAFLERLVGRTPGEADFHQAVAEVVESVWPVIEDRPEFLEAGILERLVEPDRAISFRVT